MTSNFDWAETMSLGKVASVARPLEGRALPYSLADAKPLCGRALLTLHMAAPVEAAVAPLGLHLLHHIVSPSAAQAAAAIWL